MNLVIKQFLKNIANKVVLPVTYCLGCISPIKCRKILFADSNTDHIPFSMERIHDMLSKQNYDIRFFFMDFRKSGFWEIFCHLVSFMWNYASAKYVFICNYYVPVTSCKKRTGTTVIQLWHSCGLFKKFAYDAIEDISPSYKSDVTKNLSLITVSSESCIPVWHNALRLLNCQNDLIQATGVSRTDYLFDDGWLKYCQDKFARLCPNWIDKKIVLYAPTFRGSASNPKMDPRCFEGINQLPIALGDDWVIIQKLHPHLDFFDCINMSSTELLPIADVLITDYSSILFDYILLEKPFVIFAPDYKSYTASRGMYVDPSTFPGAFVTNPLDLANAVKSSYGRKANEQYISFIKYHCGACDGCSSERILKQVGLMK